MPPSLTAVPPAVRERDGLKTRWPGLPAGDLLASVVLALRDA